VIPLPARYRPVRVLSDGAAATVVEAVDEQLGRRVAIKLLTTAAAADPELSARFRRESTLTARLAGHPHVLTVHDVGTCGGRPFIVSELLTGGTLADRIRTGAVDRGDALRWLTQAAQALDAAHAAGIVHRDLKPANLLLDGRGDLRVADFGIARDDELTAITELGLVLGTPGYMAPEQASGLEVTPASDRYALAAVAAQLLPGVGEAVIRRALDADPARRYPSAAAFVDALEGAQAGDADPTRRLVRLPRTRAYVAPAAGPGRRRRRRRSPERLLALVAAFALVAAASALAGGALTLRTLQPGAAPAAPPITSCTASAENHDANVVVTGVRPAALCRELVATMTTDEAAWVYRTGRMLRAPDRGGDELDVVCRLRRGSLHVTVYDDGGQRIGRELCGTRFGPGWVEGAVT
jgi:serine/threonine-protein kinase